MTRYAPSGPDEERWLAQYDAGRHGHVAVTVDVVMLTIRAGELSVLLVQRAGYPYRGAWALPGGFVAAGEDLDEAAVRELEEETGLSVDLSRAHLEQLRSYGRPDRDPRLRVVSVAYVAFLPDLPLPVAAAGAADVHFFAVDDLQGHDAPPLAFDHAEIIADGVERARAKLEYTPLASAFVDEPFTLPELRRVYEAVWGRDLDPANFRRKVLSIEGFVTPVGETAPAAEAGGRPAALYRRGGARLLHPAMLRPAISDR